MQKYGVDETTLEALSSQGERGVVLAFRKVIETFSLIPKSDEERDNLEDVKSFTKQYVSEKVMENPENIIYLFSSVSPDGPNSLTEIQTLRTLLEYIQKGCRQIMQQADAQQQTLVLEIYENTQYACESILQHNFLDHSNAFAVVELKRLSQDYSSEDFPEIDEDRFYPFPVFPGVYGYFSDDNRRIYLSSPELTEKIEVQIVKSRDNIQTLAHINRNVGGAAYDQELAAFGDEMIYGHYTLEDFYKKLGINDTEKIYALSEFLHSSYRKIFNETFSDTLGITLDKLTPIEQLYIVNFIKKVKIKDVSKITYFIDTYGLAGLRTFIAGEQAGTDVFFVIEKILELDSYFTLPKIGQELTAVFADILDQTEKLDEFFEQSGFAKEEISRSEKQKIASMLRERAVGILLSSLENFLLNIDSLYPGDILRNIQEIKSENILLAEVYKQLKKEDKTISIENFAQIRLLEGDPRDPRIKDMYANNYANPETAENLYNEMLANSEKPGFRYNTVEYAGQIVGAVYAVEDEVRHSVYVGGLNASDSEGLKNLRIGEFLMKKMEDKYFGEGWTVEATALLRIAALHIMNRGFVGTEDLGLDESGQRILGLKRNPTWNFDSKDRSVFTHEKIIQMAKQGLVEKGGEIAVFLTKDENQLPGQLKDGYVITQMFTQGEEIFFLLEKANHL